LNSVGARPNAPAPVPPPPAPAESKGAAKAGGQIQQAVLISKKDPEYPKLARQTGAKGAVRLVATVGKDGRVKNVKVLSGHPMLQAAAIEAVKQWIYKPTLLNGQPVETDTEIQLNFVGDR
jgi:protein TonB